MYLGANNALCNEDIVILGIYRNIILIMLPLRDLLYLICLKKMIK
jgi:hypothetical protein